MKPQASGKNKAKDFEFRTLFGDDTPPETSPKQYEFKVCELETIKAFMESHHYSRSSNVAAVYCFALMSKRKGIVGAAIYSKPAMNSIYKLYANKEEDVVELRRLVCIDDTPKNTESFFVGKTLRWLVQNTNKKTVVTYADPSFGHVGHAYRACNMKYDGVGGNTVVLELPVEKCVHDGSACLGEGKKICQVHDRNMRSKTKDGRDFTPAALHLRELYKQGIAKLVPRKPKHRYHYHLEELRTGKTQKCRQCETVKFPAVALSENNKNNTNNTPSLGLNSIVNTSLNTSVQDSEQIKEKQTPISKPKTFFLKESQHNSVFPTDWKPNLAKQVKELLPSFVVFDFEWNESGEIFAASFVNDDRQDVFLKTDFVDNTTYVETIQQTLLDYDVSIGWNSLGMNGQESDLDILKLNAERCGLEPVFNSQYRTITGKEHIDLMRVFRKLLVQGSMFKNRYRDLKLETVSQCFLNRGKIGYGEDAKNYDDEKLKQYVLNDSLLVFDLLSVGMFDEETDKPKFNGALLETMNAIAKLVDMPLSKVCNTSLSVWWSKIFEQIEAPESLDNFKIKPGDFAYQGGELIEPTPGLYKDVDVIDVQSLYPTMIENYNLSHETVCCECCKDDPLAKIPNEVIPRNYWVCRKNAGILATFIRSMKAERVKQKEAGNKAQAEGLKILINGAYGLYGSSVFKYSDRRVAELVTATARWTNFKAIKPITEDNGFKVIYGDTDSLFLVKTKPDADIGDVLTIVKEAHGVIVEHEKIFREMVITKKKHYMGAQVKKNGSIKVVTKGLEWIKGDRGKWVNNTGKKLEEAFKKQENCFAVVESALNDLNQDKVPAKDLLLGQRITKNAEDYKGNTLQKKIALLSGETAGNVAHFYKGYGGEPTLDSTKIDKKRYRELLLNCFQDVLALMKHDVTLLTRDSQTLDFLWK